MSFFNVIVPLHNSAHTLSDLLNSVVAQNEDIEVIIANDNSTDGWKSVVKKFNKKLNITVVDCDIPEGKHCPGNTRQCGLEKATGEWITFIDHDDVFVPDTFKKVREAIERDKHQYLLLTEFKEVNPETLEVIKEYDVINRLTWMHGKFYNKKNLIDKYGLHMCKDLLTHEDVYFNHNLVVLQQLEPDIQKEMVYYPICTYYWKAWPNSTSRTWGSDFIYDHMDDYIISLSKPYFDIIERWMQEEANALGAKNNVDTVSITEVIAEVEAKHKAFMDYTRKQAMNDLISMYFYFQGDRAKRGDRCNWYSYQCISEYIKKCNQELSMTRDAIVYSVMGNYRWYETAKKACFIATGEFIEVTSFKDFMYNIMN